MNANRLICRSRVCRIIRRKVTTARDTVEDTLKTLSSVKEDEPKIPLNPLGIQMLSRSIRNQVFPEHAKERETYDEAKVQRSIKHLQSHQLWGKETTTSPDVSFQLPPLYGNNVDKHFREISERYIDKYKVHLQLLASFGLPPIPEKWNYEAGWTCYKRDGTYDKVDYPSDDALIFDVEVCLSAGQFPTLAVAASNDAWYSWCSPRLVEKQFSWQKRILLRDLIPMESGVDEKSNLDSLKERLIVGHFISFDRAHIKEQYFPKKTKMRFVDTMSLHIAVAGLTSYQRILLQAGRSGSKRKDVLEAKSKTNRKTPATEWMNISSLNNLADVYRLYCGKKLNKASRDMFVNGSLDDIRNDFQSMMTYCANDVFATHSVLQELFPLFFERFPHPVTFAGMLEMSIAYLPVNQNWERYINDSQAVYDDLKQEMKLALTHLANDACELCHNEQYKNDIWLRDLDWSTSRIKVKKNVPKSASKSEPLVTQTQGDPETTAKDLEKHKHMTAEEEWQQEEAVHLPESVKTVFDKERFLFKSKFVLPGYPKWYRNLRVKSDGNDGDAGNVLMGLSAQTQVASKLLRLTWNGHPLYHSKKYGWGYLVATTLDAIGHGDSSDSVEETTSSNNVDALWEKLEQGIGDPVEISNMWRAAYGKMSSLEKSKSKKNGNGCVDNDVPIADVIVDGYSFYKLPHKDGPSHSVGNPLAKDFLSKIEDGTLQASSGTQADLVLKLSKMISYWRNACKRITSEMAVWFTDSEISSHFSDGGQESYGVILPQILMAGTVTRRAVEPTWLTASNAYDDRVGSELKSMIHAPAGYNFVGADVDSQELWIAAILGDSYFAGIHGCTAFGWMTLQGKKSDGTDMHSRTASTIGITRDQAKVLNYGRIYGAGLPFAQQLLMQFNRRLAAEETKQKAQTMYAATKGIRALSLNSLGKQIYNEHSRSKSDEDCVDDVILTKGELLQLIFDTKSPYWTHDLVKKSIWIGGTESAMFNKLEAIAQSDCPATPVLGCRISRALEPLYARNDFMTSRVNWVVQSSAVDYLHMLLVCMHWLCETYNIDARFSISIHDEVRYLVKEEDRDRCALALQVSNLLTRAMFAYHLGMHDLPQSVAFFSSVDIDTVLRKEVTMDCKTPSNPHGLHKGYGIPPGESVDIHEVLKRTNGSLHKNYDQ